MSRSWNGESLVDELSAQLGDTSTAFKTRVLGWANDIIFNIHSRHDWNNVLVKGKKRLVAGEEVQSLEVDAPEAAEIELASGGSLTSGSEYSVLFTFVQANGVETIAGEESEVVVTTDSLLSLSLTDIPTSRESLITKRFVYLKKGDDPFYFHQEIDDNFSTTLTISTETDSTIEPPDYESIRRLNGSPYFEETRTNVLEYRDVDQLRKIAQGQWAEGDPEYFSTIESNSIACYPVPSEDMELTFYYYRNPFKLYYSEESQPDLSINFKDALIAGVIAKGYAYRDRAGQEIKQAEYTNAVFDAINRGGRVANIEYQVRDIYGNFDGLEVN